MCILTEKVFEFSFNDFLLDLKSSVNMETVCQQVQLSQSCTLYMLEYSYTFRHDLRCIQTIRQTKVSYYLLLVYNDELPQDFFSFLSLNFCLLLFHNLIFRSFSIWVIFHLYCHKPWYDIPSVMMHHSYIILSHPVKQVSHLY